MKQRYPAITLASTIEKLGDLSWEPQHQLYGLRIAPSDRKASNQIDDSMRNSAPAKAKGAY
jgi:hypothetical protein